MDKNIKYINTKYIKGDNSFLFSLFFLSPINKKHRDVKYSSDGISNQFM
jgi:hypothetical protein